MAPPRRVRDEALTLCRTGLPDIELFRAKESIYVYQFPTQGRFQVAPNAQAIAYTTPGATTLTVVRRDGTMTAINGVHSDQFRISPDGRTLAVPQYDYVRQTMNRIDLATMQPFAQDALDSATWAEFSGEGLVVLQYKYTSVGTERTLVLLPWQGEGRLVAQIHDNVMRFACAKAGKNLAYFIRGQVWTVAEPGAQPVQIADLGENVVNAEMSPDGRSMLALTTRDAYLFEDGKQVAVLGLPAAHTVWFSRDGKQFVVANTHKAHWQRGQKTVILTGDDKSPIRTARFAPMSPWVMVARGSDAVRWNPDQNESEVLASADEGQEMLGVDVFGGGVVLWTGTTWQVEKRNGRLD